MGKSKYPNKLDTSVEIPVIRDNITEIGSDVLNSLRSAIFNIERTLGINPQGASGNTVASRLNNAIDDNGNITKDALDRSGLLSGPISNSDVSKVASISEEKLDLNFPTQLLQDQISILDNRIALFIISLEELNALLSAHVHPDAKNRHYAKAITVESAIVTPSSAASVSLEEGTLQEALESLYNSHINYTGEGVSQENSSHTAGQVFYDNEQTIDIVSSSSVQGAIDEIAGLQGQTLRDSILNLHSNGLIRTGSTFDSNEQNDCGSTLVPASEVAWAGPSGSSRELISFFATPEPASPIEPFDTLTILDSPNDIDNKDYLIESVTMLPSGALQSVTVFGGPKYPAEVGTNARITKSIYTTYNENGLNCSARPRYLRSNEPDIQVANPNAATIISSGIRAANVKDSYSNILSIEIDGEPHSIDIFNEDYETQDIDIIVDKINQYVIENKLNMFAYKVRALKCYELALTHVLPNFSNDTKNRTLKVTEASSDSAHEALGLGYILDREVEGLSGNTCHINGKLISSFGDIKKYSSGSIAMNPGTTNLVTVGLDFLREDIRVGDLCTIEGSSEEADDGTYRVHSVNSNLVELDATGYTFTGSLGDDAVLFFQRCSAPIGELEFEVEYLSGVACNQLLIDIFMTDSGDINYKKRASLAGHLKDSVTSFYATVTDISKGFIGQDDIFVLKVDTNGMASLRETSSPQAGAEVFVGASGRYKIYSEDKFNYVILDVRASSPPSSEESVTIYGESEIQHDVMHLSRVLYSTELGFILGNPDIGIGIPRLVDKRTTGTVDDTIVSENILERYIQGPRNELRGSGVIRDLDIKDVISHGDGKICRIDVNPGVGVINGVRVEYLGINDLFYNYDEPPTSNFYVAINGKGCLLVAPEIQDPNEPVVTYISPFSNQNVAHIAYIEIADPTFVIPPVITDLRLFVDHLDYKVVADITVATDQRFGHFTDIKSAVAYARMFKKMFPKMGTPSITIKEGRHIVKETIVIDFDLKLSGAGPQTIIERGGDLLIGNAPHPSLSPVFMIGGGTPSAAVYSGLIQDGVSMENFTYFGSPDFTPYGVVILLAQPVDKEWTSGQFFTFDKIRFQGKEQQRKELAIVLGPDNPIDGVYGNATISNCFFDWMGVGGPGATAGTGPCYLNNGNAFSNITVSGNIATNVYGLSDPGAGLSGDGHGIVWVLEPVASYYAAPYITNFSEAGNQSDDQ
jgi:hypothetical protein